MDEKKDQANKKDQDVKKPVKNAIDLQKLKLDKLFKNIEKPVHLPDPPKKRGFSAAPEFVRNVMGSSAGAGSGEFHVYRHIRRRENARVKFIAEEAAKEDKDEEYQRKLKENKILSEQRTAKKRAKRQKKKARQQGREKRPKVAAPAAPEAGDDSESDGDGSGSEPGPEQEQELEPEPERGAVERDRVRGEPETAGQGAGCEVSSAVESGAEGRCENGPASPAPEVTDTDPSDGGPSTRPGTGGPGHTADVSADSAGARSDTRDSDTHTAAELECS